MTRLEHAFERQKRRPDFLYATMVIAIGVEPQDDEQLEDDDWEILMKRAADRLTGNFRPTDTIGRMDRGRIIALYEDLKQAGDVEVIIRRLRQQLSAPVEISGRFWQLLPSIGAVLNDPHFQSPEEILEAATRAAESGG
jgi:GGDEF domain-containing protein